MTILKTVIFTLLSSVSSVLAGSFLLRTHFDNVEGECVCVCGGVGVHICLGLSVFLLHLTLGQERFEVEC